MNVPIEIFDYIIRYTDNPGLIVPFKRFLNNDTIGSLLSFTSILKAIICGDINLINFMKKNNEIEYKRELRCIEWTWLIDDHKLSDSIIIEFVDKLDWGYVVRNQVLSEKLQLKYINVHFDFIDLIRYQIIYDNHMIQTFMDNVSPEDLEEPDDLDNSYDSDFNDLLWNKKLTSVIFREYIHMFNKSHFHIIIGRKYDEKFFLNTSDLVDWKKEKAIYYNYKFIKNKKNMKRFIPRE